jgi:hypothetical protein
MLHGFRAMFLDHSNMHLISLQPNARALRTIGGSSAALLSDLLHPLPEDVDLLVSAGDAYRLLARWKTQCAKCTTSNLFHSVFGVFTVATVDIEVMGDPEISTDHGWRRLKPKSQESIQFASVRYTFPHAKSRYQS